MKYAYQDHNRTVVFAADSIKEFDNFKQGDHTFPHETVVFPDIIDMLGDPVMRRYSIGPVVLCDCPDELITANDIKLVPINRTMGAYDDMLEKARLESEMGQDEMSDRRTVGEILGITDYDPWSNLTPEQQAEQKALNEKMEAEHKAGALSDDSFSGETLQGGNIVVRDINVKIDSSGAVTGSISATRTEITPHEILVGDHSYDINDVLAKMRVPENRIIENEPGRVLVRLHSFQIEQIERFFAADGITDFSIIGEASGDEIPEDAIQNFAPGYTKEHVFFVCSSALDVPSSRALLADLSPVIASHEVSGRGWLVCLRRKQAEYLADELMTNGVDAHVVAVNRFGIPIVDPKGIFKVIDDGEVKEYGPRPWDEDTTAWDAFTTEERKAEIEKIEPGEFMFAVREGGQYGFKSRVWISPVAYFKREEKLWEGFLPIDDLVASGVLTHEKQAIFKTRYTGTETRNALSKMGLYESILLHLYLNERDSTVI